MNWWRDETLQELILKGRKYGVWKTLILGLNYSSTVDNFYLFYNFINETYKE